MATVKMPTTTAADDILKYTCIFIIFKEIRLVDNSHEMSSFSFSEKLKKKSIFENVGCYNFARPLRHYFFFFFVSTNKY